MQKLLGVVGPTAVGKSDLAIKLAKKYNGEIISGDSMQIYRNLDIGTAKVSKKEQKEIKHHLIDIYDVDQQYSVSKFVNDVSSIIKQVSDRGHLPIIVGGTGYYLQALLTGLQLGGNNSSNNDLKKKLQTKLKKEGAQSLWNYLNKIDSDAANKIPFNNSRKIVRAIEVYETTGKRFSEQNNNKPSYDSLLIGLNCNRKLLYERINKRVDIMFENGLLEENKWLYDHGDSNLPAFKGIGYREFLTYFDGDTSLNDVKNRIKLDSRHYAKRQLTWFRNKMNVNWFNIVEHPNEIEQIHKLINDWRK